MTATRLTRAALTLVAFAVAACGGGATEPPPTNGGGAVPTARPTLAQTYRASGRAAAGDVFVHLFEWRWSDIAVECESVLGPAGVAAVQVSPPQEHSVTPTGDWSQRYQPVSYSLARSRSGTATEFAAMVQRCRAAGVGIYVDAVINHMTNFPSPGVGSAGTAYSKYAYPELWTSADFHAPCRVETYQSAANVQDCELLGLPDLHTGLASVRQKLADYLIGLARQGVAGFRVDAAKHIQQVELDQIVGLVDSTLAAEGRARPFWFLEVIGADGEAITERDYLGVGHRTGGASDITEFTFVGVGDKFRKIGGQAIRDLDPNGPAGFRFSAQAWGMIPDDKAVVFLQNHDTQRSCGLGYQHGDVFRLANVWMLAQPYGHPSVLSGYAFPCPVGSTNGPPALPDGSTRPVACPARFDLAQPGEWTCEHRDPSILAMIGFRRAVAGSDVNRWWSSGPDVIAFSRGARGFVVINRSDVELVAAIPTGLAAGTYCDRLSGGLVGGTCVGQALVVDATGTVPVRIPAMRAVAVDITTRA